MLSFHVPFGGPSCTVHTTNRKFLLFTLWNFCGQKASPFSSLQNHFFFLFDSTILSFSRFFAFFFFQKSSRSFRWNFLKKQKTIKNELFDSKHRQPKSTFYILNDKVSKSMLCDRMGRGGVGLVVRVCPILRRWELETWWWLPTFFRKILLEKEQN